MPKRNSLVENINRRKRKGTSRSKAKSTVSKDSYREMQKGWPRSRRKQSAKKKTAKRPAARRKQSKRKSR